MRFKYNFVAAAFGMAALCAAGASQAQTVDPFYASSYTASNLGGIAGVPTSYGGLTFLDASTILIGGSANQPGGHIYSVPITRNATNHINGFGAVSLFGGPSSTIGEYNDGGVAFGPGNVLFLARWNVNQIGQVLPGATDESRVDAGPFNASSSVSALNFVPSGFGGAGGMKVVTYAAGQWYDAIMTSDGSGTYALTYNQVDLDPSTPLIMDTVLGSPEGFVYIPAGNAQFAANSMLLAAYGNGTIDSYQVDALGNPILGTRRTFISNLSGAEGSAIDPVTGDFLFSTFGGGNIVLVQGFLAPIPEPETYAMLLAGLGLLGFAARRQRQRQSLSF
jgi:hypothetical protein